MKRLLVTGSREFGDHDLALTALSEARWTLGPEFIVVHGAARGADRLLAEMAVTRGLVTEAHPADWRAHGRRAGFMRNQAMVDAGADLCVALLVAGLECRGTRHCAARAAAAGIPVRWYTQEAA